MENAPQLNLGELTARAEKGDAGAQYRLAAALQQAGRGAEAAPWLEKAVVAGHPGALYTRASERLAGPPEKMHPAETAASLKRAVDAGGAAAARLLAVMTALGLGAPANEADAVRLVIKAAQAGHPAALRELALLAHGLGAAGAESARVLLRLAAMRGDWIALYLALRFCGVFNVKEGEGLSAQLSAAGAPLAERLQDPTGPCAREAAAGAIDYTRLENLLTAPFARSLPSREDFHQHPDVVKCSGVLTPLECDYLICVSASLLAPSRVVDSHKGAADLANFRTSDGALIGLADLDLALIGIYRRLAAVMGAPAENCELMGVLRYRVGQEYLPHHDYLPEDAADYSEVRRSGQRTHTLLVTLNDGFKGGATAFPDLNKSVRASAGDGVIFDNTDDAGVPLPQSLHAGEPVTGGEKWIVTLWRRAKPFWFWV
ncbi:MAG: 2OG-Fe(II) oxygenase [Pseudomonadota bacterium]